MLEYLLNGRTRALSDVMDGRTDVSVCPSPWQPWLLLQYFNAISTRVVIPGVRRPFGGRTGRAGGRPCPLRLIWTGRVTVDREITIPNLLYCNNFSYCFPPTWLRGGWQSEVAADGSVPAPVWPFYLPWAVSQCPFDPYRVGAKVYRAYRAGGRPRRAARPTNNLDFNYGFQY
jgi:hypothetical protein